MLEKAILICRSEQKIVDSFTTDYLTLDDEKLLEILRSIGSEPEQIVNRILTNQLFRIEADKEMSAGKFEVTAAFIADVASTGKSSKLSDDLSNIMNEKLNLPPYQLICDFVTSRSPQEIQIDVQDSNEDNTLRGHSGIVGALKAESRVKVYQNSAAEKVIATKEIDTILKEVIEEFSEA